MISNVYIGNCKDELMKRISNILKIEKQVKEDTIDHNDNDNENVVVKENDDKNESDNKRKRRKINKTNMKSIVIGTNDINIFLEKDKISFICLCPTGKTKKSTSISDIKTNNKSNNFNNINKSKHSNQSLLDRINYNYRDSDIHRSIIEAGVLKKIPILIILGVKPVITSSDSNRKISELANLFNVKTVSCFALTKNDYIVPNDGHNDSISALKDGLKEYLETLS